MRLSTLFGSVLTLCSAVNATIYQNGQVRPNNYPNTTIAPIPQGQRTNGNWTQYNANSPKLSYQGRWDHKHISYWTAPGLKFSYTGNQVAIEFGNWTSPGVLIAYRIDGLDWQLTNVTANSTHALTDPSYSPTAPGSLKQFELRVSNWDYGVQIQSVYVQGGQLVETPAATRRIEVIGDSLSAGQYATLECIMSYPFGLAYGLGNVDFSITAYPGICLYDGGSGFCYGGQRGQERMWFKTSDNSERAAALYGNNPPNWDFSAHPAADITIINLGANDSGNNVPPKTFYETYVEFINQIRARWPQTQIIILNLWSFQESNNTWTTSSPLDPQIQAVAEHFNGGSLNEAGGHGFVHYFNTTGILQHNDISPRGHPTDVADVKLASHLMQYIKLVFGWQLEQAGPEVQHETLYWNDQTGY